MIEFCPYINDEDNRCKIETPKCLNGYELCSVWYDKFNGIEEIILGVGAPMINVTKIYGGNNGNKINNLYKN